MGAPDWGPVASSMRFLAQPRSLAWRIAFAVAVIGAAFVLRALSSYALRDYAPFLLQIPAVLLVALVGGLRVGLFGLVLAIAANALFIPWTAASGADVTGASISLASFTINGFACCLIAALLRASVVKLEQARASLDVASREKETTLATLESLLDNAPLGFAFFGRDLRIHQVNDTFARMGGLSRSDHEDLKMAALMPALAERATVLVERVFETGEIVPDVEISGAIPAMPGMHRHWLVSFYPVKDGLGAVRFVGSTVVDITEIRKAEQRLAYSERRYRLLAEALPKMVWTADPQGQGDYYNHRWQEFTGAPADGSEFGEWHSYVHPEERADLIRAWNASIASGEAFNRECRFRAADGSYRWFLCRAVPVRDEDGRVDRWYGSCTDIAEIVAAREALARSHEELERLVTQRTTELAQANERLRREMKERFATEAQLRQAQKMEAVGQLTGGIAHDFNNLLTVIVGNLEAAERRIGPDNVQARTFLDHCRQGAMRAATLTQRLLAFSRRQPLDPKPTDVNRLLVGMSQMLRSALGARVTLETVLAGGLWGAEIDRNQLENAVLNLAVNARDAMPDGGKLTIETANAYLDDAYAEAHDVAAGQYVVICVSDTGTGMSAEVMARVFEPFFSTKGPRDGTGLGLSQVYGFVKQSGGHVKIYSEVGEGTTVKLYLPRLERPVDEGEQADMRAPPEVRKARILVVEDDAQARQLGVDVLRAAGHEVSEADGADAALKLVQGLAPSRHPELLFTDISLGTGLDGPGLADRLRQIVPQIRVLFTTGYARNAVLRQGRLERGVNLLTKPFSQAELVRKVTGILEQTIDRKGAALLVEDEPFVAMVAQQILEDHGFEVTVASHGAAALAHARSGQDLPEREAFRLAVVDLGLPDMRGDAVVRELRTIISGLAIIIATGYGTEDLEGEFGGVEGIALIGKPYDGATLRGALRGLGFTILD
ncbi:response regulator [Xanthobacter tagetidis]|uniref:histidine kinase n=2 Tax=Xanthobacter tagetidis TaxID=60216 RepID=A0A3L7AGE0_9HYPH|nr:response regulator [Xanthobacter tagetidis]